LSDKLKRVIDYEYVEMNRSEIVSASYNPRRIKDRNKSNLKKSLNKFGMVESVVFNKQTGNLVSGHQRLSCLDEKHKTDQYIIGVNVIDIPLEDEKALNVILNNKNAQGEYDEFLLEELNIDLQTDCMFDTKDMEMMFGFDSDIVKDVVDDTFRDAMKRNHSAQTRANDGEDTNYNRSVDRKKLTIVFESNRQRESFDRIAFIEADAPFVSGDVILGLLNHAN
jgi:hypothetical protein